MIASSGVGVRRDPDHVLPQGRRERLPHRLPAVRREPCGKVCMATGVGGAVGCR
jgi:hypothetical protein